MIQCLEHHDHEVIHKYPLLLYNYLNYFFKKGLKKHCKSIFKPQIALARSTINMATDSLKRVQKKEKILSFDLFLFQLFDKFHLH